MAIRTITTTVDPLNGQTINTINGWLILLEPDPLNRSQKIAPDFYGFLPICSTSQAQLPI